MAEPFVLAVLGRGVVDSETPLLHADDLGVLRGDGVFEAMHLRDGIPWLLEEHLARMANSASRLDLPLPPAAALRELAGQACAGWTTKTEAALRLICTRGRESGGPPTVYATVRTLPATHLATRRDGVDVITASLGVAAAARPAAPWLLAGAKTLSYAVNMATSRWATAQGSTDVVWVSADGYLLEGPTSTLVWLMADRLCTVPPAQTGVLPGTTAAWLFAHAEQLGWNTGYELIRPENLVDADGAWLLSSVRGAARLRTLDGVKLASTDHTVRILNLLGFPH